MILGRGHWLAMAAMVLAATVPLAEPREAGNPCCGVTLARLRWGADLRGFRRGGFSAAWNHDYPRGEQHLSLIIKVITFITASSRTTIRRAG